MPKRADRVSIKRRLILASASPRRRRLMRQAGLKFMVVPSHTSERMSGDLTPAEMVKKLALKKASEVARQFRRDVVLGADTLVYVKGKIIGKPKTKSEAGDILAFLSGSWQRVYTGVAIVWWEGRLRLTRHAVSRVKFRNLSKNDILMASKNHLDKAGAYAVQQKRDPFVEKIRGDYDNVVGLPMRIVNDLLGLTAQHFLKTVGDDINFQT